MTVEEMEAFAGEHGLPALLDHLGLDGLGDYVNDLEAATEVLRDYCRMFGWDPYTDLELRAVGVLGRLGIRHRAAPWTRFGLHDSPERH